MSDYDAIRETVFHYCEGYRNKDRERLERAFSLEIANMMGYIKNKEGELELFSMTMRKAIDEWVAPDYTPFEFSDGNMLAVDIFSDAGDMNSTRRQMDREQYVICNQPTHRPHFYSKEIGCR